MQMEIKRNIYLSINLILILIIIISSVRTFNKNEDKNESKFHTIFYSRPGIYDKKYGLFSEDMRRHSLSLAKQMFTFGYDSYMKYAFPKDELNPIYCTGRGPDLDNPYVLLINIHFVEHMFQNNSLFLFWICRKYF
jgi:hypothetical protein